MIDEIKILLGDAAANYSDAEISLTYRLACAEVETYCGRDLDNTLDLIAKQITVIKLNRKNTEGLSSQSFSGVNENYLNDYPADIKAILNKKRKVKII